MTKVSILLICTAGMSTNMLVSKMKKAAKEQANDVSIVAVPATEAPAQFASKEFDVVLLGPQVSYMKANVMKQLEEKNVEVAVIDMKDYGMMNGKKVLADALNLIKKIE
ncbi:PTS sugar transporter subunit IIB [Marinilactibacillus kalidii]|uniref:PTS sugar transporter subunit IIB n=1 Tax=Marinilactibacillus kalidii TaxID=2820274 RepID=UPI001ABE4E06|nr:PTS sugar transporter subunit IIB [Marinilactibacillus kalidii]